ncbi:MAG: hypothetical protein U1C96_09675 [Gallionella sp.]|nr:hypothetical protein [Gallionella sp.]
MMNPEFRRNLWLSFSTHRLIAMPALTGLAFLALAMSDINDTAKTMYTAASALFIFIVWLWGTSNANSAIVDELRDRTWDQQRMSSLSPWSMTWGKLFGATSFNWYGGLLCLMVAALSGIAAQQPAWPVDLLSLVAGAVMLHAGIIALNLHTGQLGMRVIQRGGLGWLAIVFVLFTLPAFSSRDGNITWWSTEIDSKLFILVSVLFFAACAVFAAWRVVCNALQVRTLPWAWPLFACVLSLYLAGFFVIASTRPLFTLHSVALSIAAVMTYAALFTEQTGILTWKKLRLRQRAADWRGWLEHLPLWPTTLLLTFVFALFSTLAQPDDAASRPDYIALFAAPLCLALMVLRDAAVVLFFAFARNNRRALGAAMLYLLVINVLLPFFANVAGLPLLGYLFLPFSDQYPAVTSIFVMACHAAIALALVIWRVRETERSQA